MKVKDIHQADVEAINNMQLSLEQKDQLLNELLINYYNILWGLDTIEDRQIEKIFGITEEYTTKIQKAKQALKLAKDL